MSNDIETKVTEIVAELGADARGSSAEELIPLVYDRLRRLAAAYMQREAPDHTLQPTAVVHDAYLRLVDQSRANWKGQTHFFAVGAQIMRRILVDHARERSAAKRGADFKRVTLADALEPNSSGGLSPEELLTLNAALERLAVLDQRQAHIVTLRFFGGLTVAQVAEVLNVSKRTIEGEWRHARAWLRLQLACERQQ